MVADVGGGAEFLPGGWAEGLMIGGGAYHLAGEPGVVVRLALSLRRLSWYRFTTLKFSTITTMKLVERKIYLASKSPRRRELLRQIGVDFELMLLRSDGPRGPDVTEEVLADEPADAYEAAFCRLWFKAAGIDAVDALRGPRFEQFSMVAQAAVAGLGVALVPRFLAAEEVSAGKLLVLRSHTLSGTGGYYLVYPESRAQAPLVRSFREWILAEAGRQGDS